MGVVFVTTFENVSVSATQDLFEIIPDVNNPVTLHSLCLSNVGADVGDAAEEMLRITLRYFFQGITSGSGGSSASIIDMAGHAGISSRAAIETNNTTKVSDNSYLKMARGWNIRMPFEVIWTPETRPVIGWSSGYDNAGGAVIRLENSPADAISMSGELIFEETA
jgi:hypothetical protein